MGNNDKILLGLALLGLLLMLRRSLARYRAKAAVVDEGERSPVLVEGSTAYTGMHKGIKYWIYFDGKKARMEIEVGAEITAPLIADRRSGPAKMPGDARDGDLLELFKLRADYVEVGATGNLIAAEFPEMVLNSNSGSTYAASPEEATANKVAGLLAAIREKSRQP